MGEIIQFPTVRDRGPQADPLENGGENVGSITSDPLLQALAEGRAASDRLRASLRDRVPENVVELPIDPFTEIALACRAEAAELLARVEARKNVVELPVDPLAAIVRDASAAAAEFSRRAAETRALLEQFRSDPNGVA